MYSCLWTFVLCFSTCFRDSSPSGSFAYHLCLQICPSPLTQAPVRPLSPFPVAQAPVSPHPTRLLPTASPSQRRSTRRRRSPPSQKWSRSPCRPHDPTRSPKPPQTQHLQPNRSPPPHASSRHSHRLPQCPPPLLPHLPYPPLSSRPSFPTRTAPRCGAPASPPTLSSLCPSAQRCLCRPSGCTTSTPLRRCLRRSLTTLPNLSPSYRLPLTPPLEAAPSLPQRAPRCTRPRTARPGHPLPRHRPARPSEACRGGRVSTPSRTASWALHASTAGNSKVPTRQPIEHFYFLYRGLSLSLPHPPCLFVTSPHSRGDVQPHTGVFPRVSTPTYRCSTTWLQQVWPRPQQMDVIKPTNVRVCFTC